MAAPNIVDVTTIIGRTVRMAVTMAEQMILENPADSGKVLKVGSVYVANIDGTNAADVTLNHYDQDDLGGTAMAIASTIGVPADATLVIVSKNSAIYLEEDMSLGIIASDDDALVAFVSYEEIS